MLNNRANVNLDQQFAGWVRNAERFAKQKRRHGFHAEVVQDSVAAQVYVFFVRLDGDGEEDRATEDIEYFSPERPSGRN